MDGTLAVTARALTRGAVGASAAGELLREGECLVNVGFAIASSAGRRRDAGLLISELGLAWPCGGRRLVLGYCDRVGTVTRDLPAPSPRRQGWQERLRRGLAFARQNRRVRLLLGGQSVALILFTLIIPIEVIYAKESLDSTSAGFGLLLASWGAGIVAGSIVYAGVRDRSAANLILLSTAAIGLAYLGMAGAQSLLVACLLSVLGGTGNGIQWVSVMTALQEATPAAYQARVVGLLESSLAAMPGVGYLIGGTLTAVGSPRIAYAVAGVGTLVLVLAAMVVLRQIRLDRPRRRQEDLPPPPLVPPADPPGVTVDSGR